MMSYGDHFSAWGWVGAIAGMLLFWGLLIAAVVVLVNSAHRPEGDSGGGIGRRPSAEELLAERFARGEIDEQEYHARLGTLRGGVRP